MNEEQKKIAGDEMAAAIPTDQAAAWTLRITLDGLKRRHEQAFQRAVRAEAELDAARRDMSNCETNMRAVTTALTVLRDRGIE